VAPFVALATYAGAPDLAPDDRLLAAALERLGVRAAPAVWSNPAIDWRLFDAVVIRSCWDYHRRHGEFVSWLDDLDASRCRVWNPTAMVRWNSHKRYLADLADRGIATVPTRLVERDSSVSAADVAREEGWARFVVKPAVSASAHETRAFATPLAAHDESVIQRVVTSGDVLVQPFVDEITTDGELSLLFFDGEFSHAAIKRTRDGDFRVQSEHGGTVAPVDVAPAIVAAARESLDVLDEVPLYARADGIGDGESFRLMELELIEPNVFLAASPGSADRFARAIVRRIG
jgi:glutathione synthase/RimK-type ligase-like ATP-grasp enzyme